MAALSLIGRQEGKQESRRGDAIHIPYTYHTHTIHMPYTYHTHTIPLSMATIWHHREKTEASPCITTTSQMFSGLIYSPITPSLSRTESNHQIYLNLHTLV